MGAPANLTSEPLSDGVLLVALNRPDRLNALTFEMFNELHELCLSVQRDPSTAVVTTRLSREASAAVHRGLSTKLPRRRPQVPCRCDLTAGLTPTLRGLIGLPLGRTVG
jgi:hypothetical protein